jgi:hypothetical protein
MSVDLLDDLIRSVLNDPLPDDAPPPWGEVLARFPSSTPRLHVRRSRFRPLLVAFILAILLVPPAVAFHRQFLDLIEGKPAPKSVKVEFEHWNVMKASERESLRGMKLFAGQFSRVNARKAVGVMELPTSAGVISWWEAPQVHGGKCWLFVIGLTTSQAPRTSAGTCDTESASAAVITSVEWVEAHALPNVLIVHARVHGVGSVELQFGDGESRPMDVVAGHAVAVVAADSRPAAVVAKNAHGDVVQTTAIHLPPAMEACRGICTGSSSAGGTASHFGETKLTHP